MKHFQPETTVMPAPAFAQRRQLPVLPVPPALASRQAGIQTARDSGQKSLASRRRAMDWIPAFAGMTAFFVASLAFAQSVNIDVGSGPTSTAKIVQLILLVTVLALAPSILVMATSFTRIIVVLSFLRSALGVQQTPPNIVLISLALFLTMFIMQPVLEQAWDNGIKPLTNNQISEEQAFDKTVEPFHAFMLRHTRSKDLNLFMDLGKVEKVKEAKDTPLRVLIPAFMISELRRAFEIGFLLFLPFLIIDMVVASILMSMGMMMLPPPTISLPFKIIFFVLVDGWYLVAGSLIQSYGG